MIAERVNTAIRAAVSAWTRQHRLVKLAKVQEQLTPGSQVQGTLGCSTKTPQEGRVGSVITCAPRVLHQPSLARNRQMAHSERLLPSLCRQRRRSPSPPCAGSAGLNHPSRPDVANKQGAPHRRAQTAAHGCTNKQERAPSGFMRWPVRSPSPPTAPAGRQRCTPGSCHQCRPRGNC